MLNTCTLIGRLGADPEIRDVGGQKVARFRLATTEKWTDKEGERKERTEWHSIETWGRKAEVAAQYLAKGSLIAVTGKITYRDVGEGEAKRVYTNIRCSDFQMLSNPE